MKVKFLITLLQKHNAYEFILKKGLSTGKSEAQIIRDMFKKVDPAEVKKFHAAFRKWKSRSKLRAL